MFGTSFFSPLSPAMIKLRESRVERRMSQAVPWSPTIRWDEELNIKASTYTMRSLFDVEPLPSARITNAEPAQLAMSPCGQWVYCEKVLPKGSMLRIAQGSKTGTVVFDGDVLVPTIYEKRRREDRCPSELWMSLTPMEMITLRAGTRRAKGNVIVAGLGLGHQLIEVSKRKAVKRLTLVERNQSLVDWLLPQIEPHLGRPIDEVIVGNAHEQLPKLTADVALVDIFPNYGGNVFPTYGGKPCDGIDFIWVWGSSELR